MGLGVMSTWVSLGWAVEQLGDLRCSNITGAGMCGCHHTTMAAISFFLFICTDLAIWVNLAVRETETLDKDGDGNTLGFVP